MIGLRKDPWYGNGVERGSPPGTAHPEAVPWSFPGNGSGENGRPCHPWNPLLRLWDTSCPLSYSLLRQLFFFLFVPLPAFPSSASSVWLGVSRPSSQDCIRFGLNEMRFIYIYPAYSSRRCSEKNARNFKAFKWLD